MPAPGNAQAPAEAFPLQTGPVAVFAEDAGLGSAIAGRVGPDGSVYVVDHVNAQVAAFAPDGQLRWKRGRKGTGPQEFQLPYRVDVRPDGSILVFDLASGEITALSAGGEFVSRFPLPTRFFQVDNLVSTSGSELVVAGVVDRNSTEAGEGLHRFRVSGNTAEYLGSFAPLPLAKDPVVLRYWGAGSVALTRAGALLYSRRLPYEIYRYDPAGRQVQQFRPAMTLESTPDEFFQIDRSALSTTVAATDTRSQRPGGIVEVLDGWVLASRVSKGPDFWDLYSPAGEPAGSREVPEEWGGFLGFDRERGVLWMTGTRGEKPVLLRLRLSRGGGRTSSTRRN